MGGVSKRASASGEIVSPEFPLPPAPNHGMDQHEAGAGAEAPKLRRRTFGAPSLRDFSRGPDPSGLIGPEDGSVPMEPPERMTFHVEYVGRTFVEVYKAPRKQPCSACFSPTDGIVKFGPATREIAICADCRGVKPSG